MPSRLRELREQNYAAFIEACRRGGKAGARARKKRVWQKRKADADQREDIREAKFLLQCRDYAIECRQENERLREANLHILTEEGHDPFLGPPEVEVVMRPHTNRPRTKWTLDWDNRLVQVADTPGTVHQDRAAQKKQRKSRSAPLLELINT